MLDDLRNTAKQKKLRKSQNFDRKQQKKNNLLSCNSNRTTLIGDVVVGLVEH